MKKALLGAGAAVIGLLLIGLVAGSFMPREHVASSTIVVPASQDSVWRLVRDIERLPAWWNGVDSVARIEIAGGGEGWRQHTSMGTMDIAIERADAPAILVTRVIAEPDAPFGGTWTYRVESLGESTRITVTEAGYINSAFFRLIANTVMGMHRTMDSYLAALARHFGTEQTAEHVLIEKAS